MPVLVLATASSSPQIRTVSRERVPGRAARQPRRRGRRRAGGTRRPAPTRRRRARPGRGRPRPRARRHSRGEQVELGVEPAEPPAVVGHLRRRRGSRARCSSAQIRSKVRAMVCVRLCAPGAAAPRSRAQPVVALGPAGVVLALGAAVARVGPHLLRAAGRARRRRPPPSAACRCRCRGMVGETRVAQRRGEVAARLRGARVERLRDPQPVAATRPGSGSPARDSRLTCRSAVSTVGPRARRRRPREPGSSTSARPAAPPGRHTDDVAGPQPLQRRGGGGPAVGRAGPGQLGLAVGDARAAAGRTPSKSPEVAGHRLAVAVEGLLVAPHLPGEPDHRPVGLELRERGLQQRARPVAAELARPG